MNPIQLFVPKYRVEECLNEIRICLEKGWTGAGFKTIEFEEAWLAYTQLPYAHFLSSATAGLHLALKLLKEENNWQDGDEVITTPLTFVSTNHVILYENMVPVFADVDRFLCIDPDSLESLITPKTRAIIFVGLGGNYGQLDRVAEFCRRKDIKLILDAAHMAGTRFNGKHVGQEADVTVFSFQAVKNLPTADSGMICFADQKLDEEVRKWSWLGINKDTFSRTLSKGAYKWHYDVEVEGFKYHGNSIMAALALVGLKYLDQDNAYRRQIASWYEDFLGDSVDVVPNRDGCESSRHLVQVMVDGRDEIMLALNDHGIYPGVHYRDNTSYKMYKNRLGSTRNAQRASERIISLPMHLGLSYQDVQRTSQALLDALAFKKTSGELTHNA